MARALTAAQITEVESGLVRPVYFVEAEFGSGTINVWSGMQDFSWDSKTWQGIGSLGSISPVGETSDLRADGLTLTMTGIDPDYVALALGDIENGKPVSVWFGLLDTDNTLIGGAPILAYIGRIDSGTILDGPEQAQITINVENRLVALDIPRGHRYTKEEQRARFPGDKGLDYVTTTSLNTIVFNGGVWINNGGRWKPPGGWNE